MLLLELRSSNLTNLGSLLRSGRRVEITALRCGCACACQCRASCELRLTGAGLLIRPLPMHYAQLRRLFRLAQLLYISTSTRNNKRDL